MKFCFSAPNWTVHSVFLGRFPTHSGHQLKEKLNFWQASAPLVGIFHGVMSGQSPPWMSTFPTCRASGGGLVLVLSRRSGTDSPRSPCQSSPTRQWCKGSRLTASWSSVWRPSQSRGSVGPVDLRPGFYNALCNLIWNGDMCHTQFQWYCDDPQNRREMFTFIYRTSDLSRGWYVFSSSVSFPRNSSWRIASPGGPDDSLKKDTNLGSGFFPPWYLGVEPRPEQKCSWWISFVRSEFCVPLCDTKEGVLPPFSVANFVLQRDYWHNSASGVGVKIYLIGFLFCFGKVLCKGRFKCKVSLFQVFFGWNQFFCALLIFSYFF